MTTTRQIVLASRPEGGTASLENFRLEEASLPELKEGEVHLRLIWLSVDPYMRGRMNDARSYIPPFAIDAPLDGGAVAEVMASKSPAFAVGDIVNGQLPWAEEVVVPTEGLRKVDPAHGPLQWAVSVLGMPGFTAWVGLNEIAKVQPGETVLISAATGAVGSVAGQIAKARGLKVIGTAGGAEKCAYATEVLGYDVCLDHREGTVRDLSKAIKEAAPQGVDAYFENVGGKTLEAVVPRLNNFARIAVCGMIAWYDGKNLDEAMALPALWGQVIKRRFDIQGFIVFDHQEKSGDFLREIGPLAAQGKIALKESISEGLDSAPASLLGLMDGQNFGKQLVRVGDDP